MRAGETRGGAAGGQGKRRTRGTSPAASNRKGTTPGRGECAANWFSGISRGYMSRRRRKRRDQGDSDEDDEAEAEAAMVPTRRRARVTQRKEAEKILLPESEVVVREGSARRTLRDCTRSRFRDRDNEGIYGRVEPLGRCYQVFSTWPAERCKCRETREILSRCSASRKIVSLFISMCRIANQLFVQLLFVE